MYRTGILSPTFIEKSCSVNIKLNLPLEIISTLNKKGFMIMNNRHYERSRSYVLTDGLLNCSTTLALFFIVIDPSSRTYKYLRKIIPKIN